MSKPLNYYLKPHLLPSPTLPSTLPSARALQWTSLAQPSILLGLMTASYVVYLCSVSTWIKVSSCSRTTFMSHGSPTYLCIRTKSVNPSNLSLWRLPATWEHCWWSHRCEMLCTSSSVVEKLTWLWLETTKGWRYHFVLTYGRSTTHENIPCSCIFSSIFFEIYKDYFHLCAIPLD